MLSVTWIAAGSLMIADLDRPLTGPKTPDGAQELAGAPARIATRTMPSGRSLLSLR